jgi:hypothetical protein
MHKRAGSGAGAVLIQRRKRGATFRTGFYCIELDWKKIRSETWLTKPIRNVAMIVTVQREKLVSEIPRGTNMVDKPLTVDSKTKIN